MAVSVRKKRPTVHPHQTLKMCLTDRNFMNMATDPISWPNPMRAIGAQNLLTMPGGVSLSGYLHKKGGSQFSLMKWPLRYIIIHKGCVYYFKTSTSATPQGAFSLNGYNRVMRAAEETTSSNVFPFKIVHFSKRHRTWYFSAASEDERRKWMRHLRKEIDYYTDKKDFRDPGESDSDAESFYGPIESPLEITEVSDHPDSEFIISDEEDYLQPDGPPVRPTVPPPSYPPPPVPSVEDRITPPTSHPKGPPPPLPPPPNKTPPYPERNKPPLSFPGTPPLLPPHPPKPVLERLPRPSVPVPSSTYPRKALAGRVSGTTLPSVVIASPSTLPICRELEEKVVLNTGEKPKPFSIPNNHRLGPKPEERKPNCSIPISNMLPKPPPPGIKPKPGRPTLQRSSPDGQSFRSSVEENPLTKRVQAKHSDEESDDDYENVQLPDSVFVDTTETSAVERLFKEAYSSPQDGLYCIRNSGTKTSKVLVVWDVSLNKPRNYRVFEEDSAVFLETDLDFPSLAALVEHYHSHPLPNHGSLCLQQPYGYKPPR